MGATTSTRRPRSYSSAARSRRLKGLLLGFSFFVSLAARNSESSVFRFHENTIRQLELHRHNLQLQSTQLRDEVRRLRMSDRQLIVRLVEVQAKQKIIDDELEEIHRDIRRGFVKFVISLAGTWLSFFLCAADWAIEQCLCKGSRWQWPRAAVPSTAELPPSPSSLLALPLSPSAHQSQRQQDIEAPISSPSSPLQAEDASEARDGLASLSSPSISKTSCDRQDDGVSDEDAHIGVQAWRTLPTTQGMQYPFGGGLVCHGASQPIRREVSASEELGPIDTVGSENFDAATASLIQRMAQDFGIPCHRFSAEVWWSSEVGLLSSLRQTLDDYLPAWMVLLAHGDKEGCIALHGHIPGETARVTWKYMAKEIEGHLNDSSLSSKLRFVVVVACKGDEFAKLLPDLGLDAVGWTYKVRSFEGHAFAMSLLSAFFRDPSRGCPGAFSAALSQLHVEIDRQPKLHHRKVALLCYCGGSGAYTDAFRMVLGNDERVYTFPKSDWQEAAWQARLRGMRMLILCGAHHDETGGLILPHAREVELTKMDAIILIFPYTQQFVTKLRNSGAQLMLLFPPAQPASSKEVAQAVRFLAEAYAMEVRDPTSATASMREYFEEALEEMPHQLLRVKPELA